MIQVLEYIMQHYTLFLGGAILILLAIIGYYADKTNFGQGKNNKVDEDDNRIENNKEMPLTMQDAIQNNQIDANTEIEKQPDVLENQVIEQTTLEQQNNEGIQNRTQDEVINSNLKENSLTYESQTQDQNIDLSTEISVEQPVESVAEAERKINPLLTEEEVEKFNSEFDSILPKKEVIDTDLLSDIDDLSFDKTQKINLSDIPDLDSIELPKIKQMDVEEDIWKF